jgi:hypothetical protein
MVRNTSSQVPLIAGSRAPPAELISIDLPEFLAPIAYGFIGQEHAALDHQLFNIPLAQANAKVEPDAMADDLGREPMTLRQVRCRWWVHAASMPYEGRAGKWGCLIDNAGQPPEAIGERVGDVEFDGIYSPYPALHKTSIPDFLLVLRRRLCNTA